MKRIIILVLVITSLLSNNGLYAAQRDSSLCRIPVPDPVICMFSGIYLNNPVKYWLTEEPISTFGPEWEEYLPGITVLVGETDDAEFVKRLRKQGKIFAYHVSLLSK